MRWFRRREETRTLLRDAATAVEWWLEGKPVPTFPENTHWYWRHVLTELRNRSGW